MRALKWIAGILGVVVLAAALVFFGNFFSKNSSNVATKSSTTKSANSSSKKGIQVTGKTDDSSYKTVIKDGKYLTSKARGITAGQESNNFNMVSFESGLLDFSKEHFNTSKYVFQEGQYLSATTATDWLDRKSASNPDGLNPEDNGKTDDSRAPFYLQTLEEQDFMTQDGNDLKLAGIVIGMAMNTQDVYQKEQWGANFTQDISKADRISHGKEMAAEVVKRYRAMSGVGNDVPIYVAMYA
ncbi:CamS family sex pheromone protein, partial [Lactobacillaceae bacterium KNUT 0156]|nr:CamS family sex pheromone protein [Weissella cibaria]